MTDSQHPRIVPPLIIGSDDGLALFASTGAAVSEIEGIDVADGVFGPAFDAVGHPVHLEASPLLDAPPPPRWIDRIRRLFTSEVNVIGVSVDLASPPQPDQLVALLQERLGDDRTDLEALIATALERFELHD
jgi:hypothetical protein